MNISIEIINGIPCTAIRRSFDARCIIPNTLTILPPLPRHPLPKDTPLIFRYLAEELHISFNRKVPGFLSVEEDIKGWLFFKDKGEWTINHASYNGEHVEIAIEEVKS